MKLPSPSRRSKNQLAQTCVALALAANLAQGETILNETFAGGEIHTQALPGSAAWAKMASSVAGQKGTTLEIGDGALILTPDPMVSQGQVLAYFSEKSVSLKVGDSVTLAFTFLATKPGVAGNGFRFGLLNSNGKQVGEDGFTDNPKYLTWNGYAVWTNLVGGATSIRKRAGESATLFDGAQGVFVALPGNDKGLELVEGVAAKGSLTLKRSGEDEITATFSINGSNLTTMDHSGVCHDFDTVVFRIAQGAAASLSLRDVSITTDTAEK
ncbi:hypothetical protein BH09VER1_BH09VER1_03710 [soil metagenome]